MISSFVGITWSWENIPQIPANRRTQYFLQDENGEFQYGYDSDDGTSAQQKSLKNNEVEGSYSYIDADGKQVHVKYTAGVNGFIPEITIDGIPQKQFNIKTSKTSQNNGFTQAEKLSKNFDESSHSQNSDASYKISYNTGDHQRHEISDSNGNVRGSYSYVDEAGYHDISYIAGPKIGYKIVGGSLAQNLKLSSKSDENQNSNEFNRIRNLAEQQQTGIMRESYDDKTGQYGTSHFSNDASFEVNNFESQKNLARGQHSRSDILSQNQNAIFYRTDIKHEDDDEESLLVKDLTSNQKRQQSITSTEQSTLTLNTVSETTTPSPRQFPNDQRDVNYAKYLHPTYTIITPEEGQRSFEYGVRNAIILGFLPPKHNERFGYIYDTQ